MSSRVRSRRSIVAANWKMHKTVMESVRFMDEFKGLVPRALAEVVLCPPFTSLHALSRLVSGSGVGLGAQDVFWEEKGAFTGEISAPMLLELSCRYVIVGHSERRAFFGETDETVNKKLKACLGWGLRPILCVGERLEQREAGVARETVVRQLEGALAGVEGASLVDIVIAYEPVWAIGTGRAAMPADADEMAGLIRESIGMRYGSDVAGQLRIQYGGSVNPENIKEYARCAHIDGALVGGASLEPPSFAAIVNAFA